MTDHALIEIVEHRCSKDAAKIVADDAATWLGMCLMSGPASVALPGGRSPGRMLGALAAHPLDWPRIMVTTTDERHVQISHRLSNMGAVRRAFAGNYGQRATFISLNRTDAAARFDRPFDLVILGMSADGHVASLLRGHATEHENAPGLVDIMPDPMPIEAPVSRRTWTLQKLTSTRRSLMLISGAAKRAQLDRALHDDDVSPFGAFLREARGLVTIHWAEN